MSTESCTAGFSFTERGKFLDSKLTSALDRIEQEAVLRLAQLENLVSCPFCPYAAECPPVEVDREFRCENPECQIVSCRLCKAETHIPRTCEEAALENGISARRQIEEAMSAAMIRKCNKCEHQSVLSCDLLTGFRSHAIYQRKWMQQDDLYSARMSQHTMLRVLTIL